MKFFLAYSQDDRDYASSLAHEIERCGGDVIDPEASRADAVSETDLRGLLESAGATILLLPRARARGANNAIFEAGAAKAMGKPVYVVARRASDREIPSDIADLAILSADEKPLREVAGAIVRQAS